MSSPKMFANPYINFHGKTREAMEFYHNVLGGKLDMLTMDEGKLRPAEPGDSIMHARLLSDGAVIMGTDGSPDFPPTLGDNVAICFTGCESERMTKAFSDLAEGGQIKMPLSASAWGDMFGFMEDKYGINWMVDITSPENMSID